MTGIMRKRASVSGRVHDAKAMLPKPAHVIVVSSDEGAFGKATTALHIVVGLMQKGQRVATIDLDRDSNNLTHHLENRRTWAARVGAALPMPTHYRPVARCDGGSCDDEEVADFAAFAGAIATVEHAHDFVLIATPRIDNDLTRLAYSLADTVVTPLADSFVDIGVLSAIDPVSFAVTGVSPYAMTVREARRQRRLLDGRLSDWVVLCDRPTSINSRNRHRVAEQLGWLAVQLGFRLADGICEPVVYRELLPRGLTAFDDLNEIVLGVPAGPPHLAAQYEVRNLIESLRLPLDERRRRRADTHAQWAAA